MNDVDFHVLLPRAVDEKIKSEADRLNISKKELVLRYLSSYESYSQLLDRVALLEIKVKEIEARR